MINPIYKIVNMLFGSVDISLCLFLGGSFDGLDFFEGEIIKSKSKSSPSRKNITWGWLRKKLR
ncbi:hypothetical protein A3F05_02260 [Candidatus Saccharibacteria bacterium RIFCSPHIGHO2_12_FULL_47_17]|nr:MAG: hypothetical protein A3F05_02260 [Candidatus Saccharibacteria bacterium RIFCSPHIGHO2_12_FULL_47_17]